VVAARLGGAGAALALLVCGCAAAQDISAGQQLYEANCGRCHGMKLEGQQDWTKRLPSGRLPAPPHDETGHTWHHTDEQLLKITLEGLAPIAPGYETDMPAFAGVLTEAEVRSIFDYIKSRWPDRIRERQKARSDAVKE
jgi:mono/diheme cytochrome c family protein